SSYDVVDVGFNFRLDEPRAALGLSRLLRLAEEIEARRAAVRRYRDGLRALDGVQLVWSDEAVERGSHYAFPVLFESGDTRRQVRAALAKRGIETTRYPVLHELTAYASYGKPGALTRAESVAERHLGLPLSAHLSAENVDRVVDAIRSII